MTRALLCLVALRATALAAQTPSFAGAWQLSYPRGTRIENGEATVLRGTGVLTIVAQGDSLIGTLTGDPTPDMPPRPPARLAAKASAGETTFISHSEATLNMDGTMSTATVVSTWTLTVKGDSLVGSVQRKIEGHDMDDGQPEQPVTGTRKKG